MKLKYNNREFKSGQRVKVTINGGGEITGMLYNERNAWYILHDIKDYNGHRAENLHGYNYSWTFREERGHLTDNVNILRCAECTKEFFSIQEQLSKFLEGKIDTLYLEKKNVVKDACQLFSIYSSDSEKYGFVKFIGNKGRVTEMKFGRFLMCYINDVKKHYNVDISIDAKTVEQYHNEYISHQKECNIKIEYLKGEDILEGYRQKNYHEVLGRIGGSCMTDKTEFLKLYTQNEVVELIAVKMDNKFIGRALLWKTEKGYYMDSIYTTRDWVYSVFNVLKAEKGYLVASQNEEIRIPVNTENIEYFPYLDTFMFLTPDRKTLYNANNTKQRNSDHLNGTLYLRNTSGTYDVIRNP